MKSTIAKTAKRVRRHARIRAKVFGTSEKPRLSVYKSNTALYAQLIDDANSKTLASASTKGIKGKNGVERAFSAGQALAKKAGELKIKEVVFDRGGFIYTGQVESLAKGARDGGLKF